MEAPVESIDVNSVSIRNLTAPSSYVVYTDGEKWYGLRTASQDAEFEDADGVAVVNDALARSAELGGTQGAGLVRVTAEAGGGPLESATTLEHVHDGTGLLLEAGVTFRYTGEDQAVVLGGESVYFEFDTVAAPNATHGIVDVGLRNGFVEGDEVRGPSESLWLSDAENRLPVAAEGPSGTWIHVPRLNCTDGTDRGIVLTSATDSLIDGYVWEVTVIGPSEAGIAVGDRAEADSVRNNVFYAGVKGVPNDATRLIEINDSRNGVYLERYTPATGGTGTSSSGTAPRIASSSLSRGATTFASNARRSSPPTSGSSTRFVTRSWNWTWNRTRSTDRTRSTGTR